MVCALNPLGLTFPEDACPAGHFAYGRLDAIDTELRRIESSSWPQQSAQWNTFYDAVVPSVDRYNPSLQEMGLMIMSKTVRDMQTGLSIATNTRI